MCGVCCTCISQKQVKPAVWLQAGHFYWPPQIQREEKPKSREENQTVIFNRALTCEWVLYLLSLRTTWCWGWSCSRHWWTCPGSCWPAQTEKRRNGRFCCWAAWTDVDVQQREVEHCRKSKWWRLKMHSDIVAVFRFIYCLLGCSAAHVVGRLPHSSWPFTFMKHSRRILC